MSLVEQGITAAALQQIDSEVQEAVAAAIEFAKSVVAQTGGRLTGRVCSVNPLKPVPAQRGYIMREITYTEALLEAFGEEMRRDDRVFHLCGALGLLERLIPEFGAERVRVCPSPKKPTSAPASAPPAAAFVPLSARG